MGRVYDTICQRRTIRRFQQKLICEKSLIEVVNAARLAPSGANLQPCEYIIVTDEQLKRQIFPLLKWAAYIAPTGNPKDDEKPTAYILVLIDFHKKKKNGEVDAAAAIENLLLAAWEKGIGSCWIETMNRKKMKKLFRIPHHLKLNSIIALGYPAESPLLEDMQNSIRYWKDEKGVLHVPKRKLEDICFINGYTFS